MPVPPPNSFDLITQLRRPVNAHKGLGGKVLLMGGAQGIGSIGLMPSELTPAIRNVINQQLNSQIDPPFYQTHKNL